MKKIILVIAVVLAVVLMFVFSCFSIENHSISLEESIENASGAIRVQEKRRFDLIPNLVECVKDYNRHEYETLVGVIQSRGLNASSAEEIKTLLNAVSESYPELKANENYKNLMSELALTENKIAKMRDGYNSLVTEYKWYTRKFPSKQLLGIRGYEVKEYERLEFENSSVDAPKVQF